MPIAWIFFGYCAACVVILPIIVGLRSPTPCRSVLLSVLCAALGLAAFFAVLKMSGLRLPPSASAILGVFTGTAAVAAIVGWFAHRVSRFYCQQPPLAATWGALQFVALAVIKLGGLYFVIDCFWKLGAIAFADEIPQIMYLRLDWRHYAYTGAGAVVVLAWSVMAARRTRATYPAFSAILQVLPAAALVLLLVPLLLAYPQFMDRTPLLDCALPNLPAYIAHLADYGRFVLDALTTGATLGVSSHFGWQISRCMPLPPVAPVTFALNLAPAALVALIVFRYTRLRRVEAP